MKLLIGTNNLNKLKQFKRILAHHLPEMEVLSLAEVGITDDVEEDGETLLSNAEKKAKYYAEKSHLPTLSDDTGLFVDALNGEPGLHSKRWHTGNEEESYLKILERLKNIPEEKRSARYLGALAFYDPKKKIAWHYEGAIQGTIANEPRPGGGFGYDPIFITQAFNRYYSQLSPEEIDSINHRGLGVKELKIFLKK